MEYGPYVWTVASKFICGNLSKVQQRANMHFNDAKVSNSIDSLENRRQVGYIPLSYCYYKGFYQNKIRGLVSKINVVLHNTLTTTSGPLINGLHNALQKEIVLQRNYQYV